MIKYLRELLIFIDRKIKLTKSDKDTLYIHLYKLYILYIYTYIYLYNLYMLYIYFL